MPVAKMIFWISVAYMAYTYLGYPVILNVLASLFPRKIHRKRPDDPPFVSIVIAAKNEASNIGRRIEDLLRQDYPADRMEIIVVSDGPNDGTDVILDGYAGRTIPGGPVIRHLRQQKSRGKPAALNAGIESAKGEFIVFTDSRQQFEPDAVMRLIEDFNDPAVGAVSGELFVREDSETTIKAEMGLYWNLEKWIRRTESRIHSVAGATGAIYAVRRSLADPLPEETILDDVLVPMRAVLRGYRTVFETRAVAWDVVSKDLTQEKRRKVRTLLGNYQLLRLMPDLLSPRKNPILFQFLSHKILRLFVPIFFIAAMISAPLTGDGVYIFFFFVSIAVLLSPLAGDRLGKVPVAGKIVSVSRTFTSLNWFALLAFIEFVSPGEKDVW
ncbi:MAG TPA: glycosyltransferase family 2 protein [Candidatus Krumholzibacterium sp.]|nr:glycosyltransferase family 2 protein [Candidatus Krumholzibacterium sp.]